MLTPIFFLKIFIPHTINAVTILFFGVHNSALQVTTRLIFVVWSLP